MKIASVNLTLTCICVGLLAIGLMLPSIGKADVVGAWIFEGSGDVATDSSGNENHGRIEGGAQRVTGKVGGGLEFDGVDDQILVPHSESLALTEAVSITAWAYPNGPQPPTRDGVTAAGSAIMIKNDQVGWSLKSWDDIGEEQITWRFDVAGKWDVAANAGMLNEWQHLAAVYDRQTGILFINGEIVSENARPNPIKGGDGDLNIGVRLYGDANHNLRLKGTLDEVGLFNTAITESDVKDIMDNGLGKVLASVSPREKLATAWGRIKAGR